jgi:hypothetical protein
MNGIATVQRDVIDPGLGGGSLDQPLLACLWRGERNCATKGLELVRPCPNDSTERG